MVLEEGYNKCCDFIDVYLWWQKKVTINVVFSERFIITVKGYNFCTGYLL